jgi:hypothetical protein
MFVFLSLLTFAAPAAAQQVCAERAAILLHLDKNYGETPAGLGIGPGGARIVELLTSATGTWTIIVSTPRGPTCLLANGQNWQTAALPEPDPGI